MVITSARMYAPGDHKSSITISTFRLTSGLRNLLIEQLFIFSQLFNILECQIETGDNDENN